MTHRLRARWIAFLPALLLLLINACGGSSSTSPRKHKTATPTPTATPLQNVQAQAPVNGVVAILGKPGSAPGAGTVQGSTGAGAPAGAKPSFRSSGCTASGSGAAHPDGSFSLSICASAGDHVNLTHSSGGSSTSLGFVTVPSTTSLPTCPAGFRTFKYTNGSPNELWIGLATGAGPPPVTCTVADQTTCGPNQNCLATNACTSYAQCADANQCDTNNGVCMVAVGQCAGGSASSTVTLNQNECVGRQGVSCNVSGCDTNFTCDTTTGLCTTTVPSLQTSSACSTSANCGSNTSCTWTNQVAECTGGSCFFAQINPGENQACQSNSDCTTNGQVCNTNLGLCQYIPASIPQNDLELTQGASTVVCLPGGVAPSSVWATGKINDTTTPCTQDTQCASGRCYITGTSGKFAPHVPPSATDCSQAQPGQTCTCSAIIGWSGNTFARTGCQSDGTQCLSGDCLNSAYQNCPVGKGGIPPDTLAEFTLQTNATDFYDVSIINGANTAIQMAPDPASSPAPAPGGASQYWCETPGSTSAQTGGLQACSWDFDLTSIAPSAGATPANQTALLTQISLPTCNPNTAGCPAGSSCESTGSDPTTGAATYTCIPNQQTCTTSSQCPTGLPCVNGFCSLSTVCTSNSQCPGTAPNCSNGFCVPGCSTDTDCANSKTALESATCLNSICVPLTCDSTVTCPTGFTCSSGTGAGTCQPTQSSCSVTQPCPDSHQVCDIPSGMATGTCVTQTQCPVDGSCPSNAACNAGNCVLTSCTSDTDCSTVGGTCNTASGQCQPFGCDKTVSCPSGMTCSGSGTCIASCSSESACSTSPFGSTCGTGLIGASLIQTCGSATGGLWTYDDFCPFVGANQQFGPVDCSATAQNPSAGTPDTIANMFGCNGNPNGSAVSCYNTTAPTIAPNTCCGCPTATGVAPDWPTVLASGFTNCTDTSPAWQDDVLPWLHYLKDSCPTAYSFPFDDATSTFTCFTVGTGTVPSPLPSATVSPTPIPNVMNYDITFGPFSINSAAPTPTSTATPAAISRR